ncbi:MAG: hypothetical protein ACYC61_15590 [Isosphaeraceae bacterium]
MSRLTALLGSTAIALGLAALGPAGPQGPPGGPGAGPRAKGKGAPKKKAEREPGGDLRKAYDLLRRLRADEAAAARPDARIRDWTRHAVEFYREGLHAQAGGELERAREYGAAAHDLARAVDHARNASRYDRPDPDLPAPGGDFGAGDTRIRASRDLRRAYERLVWLGTWRPGAGSEVYMKAARDLYNAGRRDLEAGRDERAGELARAAEAMTHIPEHLARATVALQPPPPPPPGPSPEPEPPAGKPKADRSAPPAVLPPILPPD